MNTTQTTAAILSTLTTTQAYRLSQWCRARAEKLATMPKSDQQKAIQEQAALLARR
jgi:hypothetical protein